MRPVVSKMKHCYPAILAVLGLVLQGCIVSGGKTEKNLPDASLLTGSIINGQDAAPDAVPLSDQKIIHDLIAGIDRKNIANKSFTWSNKDTGSRGTVSTVTEIENQGQTCRIFQTSRESFDGVMLLSGKICEYPGNKWKIVNLKAL